MAKIDPRWAENSAYNIIQELAIGFEKSQILFTAVKLDIFSIIKDTPKTAVEISNTLNTNPKYLERLLDALVALRLLNKTADAYSNTELSAKHLVKTSYDYYGYLAHNSDLWDNWGTLYDVIKTGKITKNIPANLKGEEWIQNFLESLDYRSKLESEYVLKLFPNINNFNRMLILGPGGFRYAIELVNKYPNLDIYRFDYPQIIDVLEKKLEKEYTGNKIHLVKGYLLNDDFGDNYNCIYLESFLQIYSVLDNIDLLKRLYKALAKGGKLIIHQPIISDDRTTPLVSVLEAVSLLVNTDHGNVYTHSDMWVTMKEAGFGNIEFFKTSFNTQVVVATKSIIG
ncbi:MAG: hypothetical protein IJK61_04970 [Bacteroidetes bacterium]|nr:hypothetical protein [Bacteroidota bacterium]